MRSVVLGLLICAVTLWAGCIYIGTDPPPALGEAKLVFINNTDSRLCYGRLPSWVIGESCSAPVKPDGKTVWRPECRSGAGLLPLGYDKGEPLGVVLAEAEGEREMIYQGFARCDETTTFEIERSDEEFIIKKSVSNPLPTDKPLPTMRP